jgi:uncharacterized membrane protein YdjX (TVP38/TMEM64 family)
VHKQEAALTVALSCGLRCTHKSTLNEFQGLIPPSPPSKGGRINLSPLLVVIALITISIATLGFAAPAFAQGLDNSFNPQGLIRNSLQWVESLGIWGGVAFIGIYILATIAFLPASLITLAAGVVFGVVWGSVYVFVGATLGAIAAFLVGRYLLRGWVSKQIAGNEKFTAIDHAVAKEGLKIVLLTRLSPVFPFNLLNYAFGVTGVTLKDYALGSIGMIPGTIMYVYIGSLAGDIAKIGTANQPTNSTLQWIINIVGLIATIAVTVFITRIATKALGTKIKE